MRIRQQTKMIVAVQKFLQLLANTHTVQLEDRKATHTGTRVPTVQRPVARVDSEFSLTQNIKSGYIAREIRHVRQHNRWTIKFIGLHQRTKHLRVVRV